MSGVVGSASGTLRYSSSPNLSSPPASEPGSPPPARPLGDNQSALNGRDTAIHGVDAGMSQLFAIFFYFYFTFFTSFA